MSAVLFVVITAIPEMSPTLNLVWMSRLMMPHLYQENRRKVYSHKEIFLDNRTDSKAGLRRLERAGKGEWLGFYDG